MINFKQKVFTEYDAMKSLYQEIVKRSQGDRRRLYPIINSSSLLPILKGNNVVVERFVITTSMFGRDKFRMYLKIGAKAKMPDEVRLPGKVYDKDLANMSLSFSGKLFSNKNKNKNNNNNNNGGGGDGLIKANISPKISIKKKVTELLGEAIKYDKVDRSLVLEFNTIGDAIEALNILPFGIDYKIYFLDV
jgi:hypothetical protein